MHLIFFLPLLISKFHSERRTPSVPSECFGWLRSQNAHSISSFSVCVCVLVMLCNGIESLCQAHKFPETRKSLSENYMRTALKYPSA